MDIVDSLSIGVDISSYEKDVLVVMRHRYDGKIDVINVIQDEEAIEIYNKLIGK